VSHNAGGSWEPFGEGLERPGAYPFGAGTVAVDASGAVVYAGTSEGVFEYRISPALPPSIASVSPGSGSGGGGDTLTITGTDFAPGVSVTVGGVAAGGVSRQDQTLLLAVTPAGAAGVVDVTVENPDTQFAEAAAAFIFDFADVPPNNPFHDAVVRLARHRITAGCGSDRFCPDAGLTRVQAAVLIETALHGPNFDYGLPYSRFADVDPCGPTGRFVALFKAEGLSAGCAPELFCPDEAVARDQAAVFLLKAKHGAAYVPPACTGIFADVACGPVPDFAVDWIEALYQEGITAGCGVAPLRFCPGDTVTRAQMAAFLVTALALD
jgi:hypothetical protein